MTTKRVLLLITNLGKGGAQRVFFDHALAFSCTYSIEEAVFDCNQDQRIYDSGLPLHDLKRKDLLSRLGPIGRLFSRALALRQLVLTQRFDVVISHLDGANWVNVLSLSRAKKILVVHGSVLHDCGQSEIRKWFRINIIPWLIYNRAERTIAVSEGVNRELTNVCNVKNVYTVNNFFEVNQIIDHASSPLSSDETSIFEGGNVLITSGRLTTGKRQSALLQIIAELKRRKVKICLVVLGDGEIRKSLLLEADQLGLKIYQVWDTNQPISNCFDIYFMGYVSNPYKYLSRATLFLFPSAWEGFPLALCEAMICGVPVLSADCPTGPREILAPDTDRHSYDLRVAEIALNGVLLPMVVSLQDLAVWTDTVQKLLKDSVLRSQLSENGIQAMKNLDSGVVICRWHEIIEAACDTN